MNTETKTKNFFMRAALLLVTLASATTAWADSWPEYITDVVLAGGTESEATSVKNSSTYSGYTWCSTSLNDGTSGDVIYIGYKKGSRANVNGGYITDFIIIDAGTGTEGHNPPYSLTFQGRTYYRCPAAGGDYFVNSNHGNLTSQAANGWNMYLYYTKNSFDDKRAVDGISIYSVGDINEHKSGAINCYYKDGTLHEKEISLNKGVSKTPYVYMHINTVTKTNRPSTDPVMASNLTYTSNPQQLIATGATMPTGTMYYRLGTSGSETSTVSDVKATNAGSYTVYYYAASNSYSNQSETHSATVTIAKSPNNGATVSCSNYLEGTTPVPSLGGTNLSTGAVTYKFCTTQNGTYTTTAPSTPGTYWVKATIASDNNCDEYTTAATSFNIIYDWRKHNSGDTEDDAYVISTIADLKYLAVWVNSGNDYAGKFFKLGGNIAFDKNTENNFTPIGTSTSTISRPFKGTFDGQGYTISGLNINKPNNDYIGLFGYANGATIKNLIVDNSTITGHRYVGGILGFGGGTETTVENCLVTSSVTVSGTYIIVGGIVGIYTTVRGCTSAADVSGRQNVGGIIGYGKDSTVDHCLYTGSTVTATNPDYPYKGAITGDKINGSFTANYYTANGLGGVDGSDINGARKAVAINTADGVTVTPTGTATTYNVSGITAYADNNVIGYGGHLYAGATEEVNLDITYESPYEGFRFEGYTDGKGNTLTHVGGNTYKLTMPTTTAYITPAGSDLWGETDGTGRNGSADHPYLITTPAGLDLLAQKVNGGTSYSGTYFELGNDIVYAPDVLTLDLDGDGNNDSNYMPVGNNNSSFYGNFDGQGHTISGIRVNANGIYYIGVFGINASTGTVKNLTVSDCLFAGDGYVGAIAGLNRGTVENCHVAADVSVTGNNGVGGIVGNNDGTTHRGFVLGCTSAATLSAKESAGFFGGIAGRNAGTLTDNLFTGTIDKMPDGSWSIGAITGYHDTDYSGTLTNNFHTCSGMGGVGNENDATNTDQAGAQFAYEFPTANGAMGNTGSTYGTGDYTGITAYANGLAYNGKYYCPSLWGGSGTAEDPYIIVNTQGMDKLATDVNSGERYSGKYFELGADIEYDKAVENNYTPIGNGNNSFFGTFDGKGHTISGIRISDTNGTRKAIFGWVDGTVKNLVVNDCRIEAHQDIGGIVATLQGGTIENCHVGSNVTLTGNSYVGGIAYIIEGGTIKGCTSAATIIGTKASGMNAQWLGGIAGYASRYAGAGANPTLTDNLFTGTISGDLRDYIGAIVGENGCDESIFTNNYHTLSGMGGVGNENDATSSDEDGALLAVSSTTKPDAATIGTAGTPYAEDETYQGITPYSKGLYYDGRYYWHEAFLRGDANGDGQVTITDAVAVVNYILGNPSENFNKAAANVNGDTDEHGEPVISITDAVGVVNIILNSQGN